jgi:putative flippase GtrA
MRLLIEQFLRFTGVGCLSAVGHYGLLMALVQCAGITPVNAAFAGATMGALINYLLNFRYTFCSHASHVGTIPKFVIVALISILANQALIWVLITRLAMYYLFAQLLTTAILLLCSFAAGRYWTFRT